MWTCRVCGEHIEDQFDACWKCSPRGAAETMADEPPPEDAADPRQHCPDCLGQMQSIKLIDATRSPGLDHQGMQHIGLAYAAEDAQRSFFLGKIPQLGTVHGKICPKCGRILLYGQPNP